MPPSPTDAEMHLRSRFVADRSSGPTTPGMPVGGFASESDRLRWEEQLAEKKFREKIERAGVRREQATPRVTDEQLQGFIDGLPSGTAREQVASRRATFGAATQRAIGGVSALDHCSACGRPIYGTHEAPVRDRDGRFRHGRCA